MEKYDVIRHIPCDFQSAPHSPEKIDVMQYDSNVRYMAVSFFDNRRIWPIPDGFSVNLRMEKSDGKVVLNPSSVLQGNLALFQVTQQMCVVVGEHPFVVEVIDGENAIYSFPCILNVVENPVSQGEIDSTDEFKTLDELVKEAQEAADSAAQSAEEAKNVIPPGGTAGQVLTKKSDADRDMGWQDPTGGGGSGENGATFVPDVSEDGIISWTNDKDLPNPEPVNIMGPSGKDGDKGDPGQAATIQVGTVTTGEPGTPAEVTNSGTENAAVFDFVIPKGDPGEGAKSLDADNVIFSQDITLAGNYTQFGNLTKSANGTSVFAVKGKSVLEAFVEILSKRLQPSITAQPSVTGFALSGAKAVEAGTTLASVSFGTARLNPGSYTYGPATGVTAESYQVDRVAVPSSMSQTGIATSNSGTDDNGGAGFVIGDGGEANTVSSLRYTATVEHSAGVVALDNLGDESNPPVQIQAGSKSQNTSAYTSFRQYFYGATTDKPSINSDYIRSLTGSGKAYGATTLTLNVPAGATRVCIACIGTAVGVTRVINETALNADVTSTFTKTSVDVAGANGYHPLAYNVWTFEPALPYENPATLKVTLG